VKKRENWTGNSAPRGIRAEEKKLNLSTQNMGSQRPFTLPPQIIFSLHFVGFSINEACILLRDDYIIYIALYIASKLRHKAKTSLFLNWENRA